MDTRTLISGPIAAEEYAGMGYQVDGIEESQTFLVTLNGPTGQAKVESNL